MSRRPRLSILWILSATFLGVLFTVPSAWANILGNPSFEVPIGDSAVNWDDTNGTTRIGTPPAGFAAFPDGSSAILQDATSDFTFQTEKDFQPGDLVIFSGLAQSTVAAGGGSGGQLRIEFKAYDLTTGADYLVSDVTSDLITSTNAPTAGGYVRFTILGRIPPGIGLIVFTIRRQGANAGSVVYDNVNGEINPAKLTLTASKTNVKVGDVVTVVADFENNAANNLTTTELKVEVPRGLDILADSIRNNGAATSIREGSTIIASSTTLQPTDKVRIVFQILVTSGASLGKAYEIVASVLAGGVGTTATGGQVSETRSVTLRVRGDPLFDEGTILGKVFDDRNQDGMQTKGEIGVPRVRIYTEYGVSVVTDKDGRFHIPAVQPGRHVLKVDGHTLPPDTRFLTEESLLVKTTPGLLNKVSFAVYLPDSALPEEFRKDLMIWVTQGIDMTQPQLNVTLEPDVLKVGLGRLEREPTFTIKTNYGEYIAGWRLEVINEMGEKIWTGIGISQPLSRVPWSGMTDSGEIIAPGTYGYRLVVRDSQEREDWTPLHFFQVARKAETFETGTKPTEIPAVGALNIFRDGKRSIPLVARPTVRVYGKTQPGRRVTIGDVPIEVGPTGEFEQELFVAPGEKKIAVSSTSAEGETVTVEDKIKVKDSFFFMVALGEEEMGVNFMKGSVETSGHDDIYHEGFYEDGRLAYYLKAKIKGKFLVKSRYDTADKRSELFTHLDPDEYYPVYGDYSELDYEGQETRERFFILVEMDRSFLKWGSYHTAFTETELARYNRTLSGFKAHYETLASTKYGDAKKGFSVFWAKPEYLADHNEFRGTGGSLYYLRQRNVISGSEKIRIEVRDKIQDIAIESRDLVAGKDYEIDYRQGRILLREPLSSVAASQTIISSDILDGNPVFLIVDYEFETFKQFEDGSAGFRGFTHMGDHIRLGATAVEERRQNIDYDLRGVDAVVRAGRNTKLTMEIAQSIRQQLRQATSYNGGLSFQSQSPVGFRRPRETAYLIKAESKPHERVEVSGYIQNIKPGFSVEHLKNQEGFRKYGLQSRLKIANTFYLLGRHDSSELSAELRPLASHGLRASLERIRSSTVQAVFEPGRWSFIGEYLHQNLDIPLFENRIPSLLSEMPFRNAFGVKIARKVSDWLTPYMRGQVTFARDNNFQIGGGLEAKLGERTKAYFEQMAGEAGDATLIGISRQKDEKTTSYATIKVRDFGFGERKVSTSAGSSHQLSERSRVYSQREYSTYTGNLPLSLTPAFAGDIANPGLWSSDVYGYETEFSDRWNFGLRFERRHLDSEDFRALSTNAAEDLGRTNTWNTISGSIGYDEGNRLKWSSAVEARLEPTAPKTRQWVTQNILEYQINQDLAFLGRTNFGNSRFVDPSDLTGRFLEMNMGFAYRPVKSDRFNALTKYTFLDERGSDAQFIGLDAGGVETDERAHTFALEGAYDLNRWFQLVEKTAYRIGTFKTGVASPVRIGTFLWINRINYHLTRKWDLGLEYRMLIQGRTADTFRHGPLVEIDRELYDYIRVGIGYNFTDFDDDLRSISDFRKNSLFFRLSGKV